MKEREANHQKPIPKSLFFSLALPGRTYRSGVFGSCTLFSWYTFHEVPISTDRQESRLAMLAGNFSVWSTASSLMVRCRATRRLEAQDNRIGIKKRFRRMKSKISSRKIIMLSLLVTGLSSLCPDLCTDQHKD